MSEIAMEENRKVTQRADEGMLLLSRSCIKVRIMLYFEKRIKPHAHTKSENLRICITKNKIPQMY